MPYHREAGTTKFGKMKLGGEIRPTEKVTVQLGDQSVEVEVTKPPWADEDPELWEARACLRLTVSRLPSVPCTASLAAGASTRPRGPPRPFPPSLHSAQPSPISSPSWRGVFHVSLCRVCVDNSFMNLCNVIVKISKYVSAKACAKHTAVHVRNPLSGFWRACGAQFRRACGAQFRNQSPAGHPPDFLNGLRNQAQNHL